MAASLHTEVESKYLFDNIFDLPTADREDHTFCGVQFDISVNRGAPITQLVVTHLSIRGQLGPIKIFVTKEYVGHSEVSTDSEAWEEVYSGYLEASWEAYAKITLFTNVIIPKNFKRGFYIHSTARGDGSIVYDNFRGNSASVLPHDLNITVHPGKAHLSNVAFSEFGGFGWGGCWRSNRTFVGLISYGTRAMLWTPTIHSEYPYKWRRSAATFYMINATSFHVGLPADVVLYILNMCSWDWFDYADDVDDNGRKTKTLTELIMGSSSSSSRRASRASNGGAIVKERNSCSVS